MVGQLKAPGPARKHPLFMAKQFTLDQLPWQRRKVYLRSAVDGFWDFAQISTGAPILCPYPSRPAPTPSYRWQRLVAPVAKRILYRHSRRGFDLSGAHPKSPIVDKYSRLQAVLFTAGSPPMPGSTPLLPAGAPQLRFSIVPAFRVFDSRIPGAL